MHARRLTEVPTLPCVQVVQDRIKVMTVTTVQRMRTMVLIWALRIVLWTRIWIQLQPHWKVNVSRLSLMAWTVCICKRHIRHCMTTHATLLAFIGT